MLKLDSKTLLEQTGTVNHNHVAVDARQALPVNHWMSAIVTVEVTVG